MFQRYIRPLVAAFLFISFAQKASAAFFYITPNVGYKNHAIKLTDVSNAETSVKMSGPVYGLKLGIQTLGGVGFDIAGAYSSGKATEAAGSTEVESQYKHTTAAAQVSVSANLFKIYLGYLFLNNFDYDSYYPSGSAQVKGPGYQVGLAFLITRSISLGAQYEIHQFNQISYDSVGNYEDIKKYFSKIDSQSTSFNLSVSF